MARNVISGHLQTEMTYLVIHLKPEMTKCTDRVTIDYQTEKIKKLAYLLF